MTRFLVYSLIGFWAVYPGTICAQTLHAPFVGTPQNVVEAMLDLGGVSPADYLIDLGSGDGRIVIAAAKRGAAGHGVDIDAELVELSRENASKAGVDDLVMFFEEDIFDTDFSMASVVTIYMSQQVNRDLKPHFLKNMMPGSRVISHIFDMDGWKPDLSKEMGRHTVYGWIIPANINGNWTLQTGDVQIRVYFEQTYQQINVVQFDVDGTSAGWDITRAEIRGDRITLGIEHSTDKILYLFNGVVTGSTMEGFVQIQSDGRDSIAKWQGFREAS